VCVDFIFHALNTR